MTIIVRHQSQGWLSGFSGTKRHCITAALRQASCILDIEYKKPNLGPLIAGISVATVICVVSPAEAQSAKGVMATENDLTAKSVTVGKVRLDTNGLDASDGGKNATVYGATGMGATDGINVTAIGATGLTIANGPTITVAGIDAGGKKLSNLTAGTDDTDAANVGQIKAVAAVAGNSVQYDDATHKSVTIADGSSRIAAYSATGSVVTDGAHTSAFGATGLQTDDDAGNVANYMASSAAITDGTNTSAMTATGLQAQNTSGNAAVYGATGSVVTNGTHATRLGATGLAIENGPSVTAGGMDAGGKRITGVAAGTDDSDAANVGQIKVVASVAGNSIQYDDPTHQSITLGGSGAAGPVALRNVAAGSVARGSSDAINGAQLFASSQGLADALAGGARVQADGTLSRPTYRIGGKSYGNVGDTFGAVDQNLTSLNNQIGSINSGGGIRYLHTNSALADAQATGQDSVATGPAAVASGVSSVATGNGAHAKADNSVAVGAGASANNAGDVALGAGSTTAAAVQTSTMEVNRKTYAVAGTATATVSVGSAGAERTIINVAAGRVKQGSTDAVNGSQLYATNQEIASIGQQVGTVGAVAKNSVQYDTDASGKRKNSITLQGGDANAPVVLSNVATGKSDADAVNVRQLKDVSTTTLASANGYTDTRTAAAISTANNYTDTQSAQTLSSANAYTDQKFGMLSSSIGEVRNEARQAAAIGLAASSLRYDDRPGKISAAVGGGVWRDQGAFAMGLGYASEDQGMRANVSATTAGGQWGVGAGLSFTFN